MMPHQHDDEHDQEAWTVDAAEEQRADQEVRRLLTKHGQPAPLEPPPDLVLHIQRQLPTVSPLAAAAAEQRHARLLLAGQTLVLLLALLLVALGSWGVLVDSGAPARLFGGTTAGLGQLVLLLVLLAKPLVHALLAAGAPVLLLGMALCGVLLWVWWRTVRRTPLGGVPRAGA